MPSGIGSMGQAMAQAYGGEAEEKRVTCFHCDKEIEGKECIEVVHWGPSKSLGQRADRVFHVECFEELAGTAHIPPLPSDEFYKKLTEKIQGDLEKSLEKAAKGSEDKTQKVEDKSLFGKIFG